MMVLLIAGIGVILAGLAAIGFGIPVKEFGFGNTLILSGTVGICTGLVMISLGLVIRELKQLALAFAPDEVRPQMPRSEVDRAPPAGETGDGEAPVVPAGPIPAVGRDTPPQEPAPDADVPPWQDAVLRDRERLASSAGGQPEEPKRRNLMFSSTRRDRAKEQSEAAVAEALQLDLDTPEPAPPEAAAPAAEPRNFETAWPQVDRPLPERPRFSDTIRRAARASATHSDHVPDFSEIPDREPPAAAEPERAQGVTVLKSGVVDGMAYSLYSDGSIEAQMPEGLMRFASIDELRAHLDNRG